MTTSYEELIQRVVEEFQALANATRLTDSVLRYKVHGGYLATIESVGGSRICRPARQDSVWGRPISTTDPQLRKVATQTTAELQDIIRSLTRTYGFVEAEFGGGRIISILTKIALCCPPRSLVCR